MHHRTQSCCTLDESGFHDHPYCLCPFCAADTVDEINGKYGKEAGNTWVMFCDGPEGREILGWRVLLLPPGGWPVDQFNAALCEQGIKHPRDGFFGVGNLGG